MELLFVFAHWHGLAKLRQHTDASIAILRDVTRQLGEKLREFKLKTCDKLQTKELPREATARRRRAADSSSSSQRKCAENSTTRNNDLHAADLSLSSPVASFPSVAAASTSRSQVHDNNVQASTGATSGQLKKSLNLNTVKMHFLGDYPSMISRLGTTDSYTTQWVSDVLITLIFESEILPSRI